MNIYLIRHGQTNWNTLGKIQGREDVPLSGEGERQVRSAAEILRGLHVTALISSPLMRAKTTAEIFAEYIDAPVKIDERLIERDFGSASGTQAFAFDPGGDMGDMEKLDDVSRRMIEAICEYAKASDGDFAVFSHGASINAVLRTLSDWEIGSGKTRIQNTGICVLSYDSGRLSISDYNLSPMEFRGKYMR